MAAADIRVTQQQGQHLSQEQRLSLRMQQRLKLLPLPLPELLPTLNAAAAANPFLQYEPPLRTAPSFDTLADSERQRDAGSDVDTLLSSYEGWGDQADFVDRTEAERRHDFAVLSQTERPTLYRHLEEQVLQQTEPGHRRDRILFLCDALDTDGYLRAPDGTGGYLPADANTLSRLVNDWWQICGETSRTEADALEEDLRFVQHLDPPGVGARTLAECLALQVRADTRPTPLRALRLRLCHNLPQLLEKTPEKLALDLRCTPAELADTLRYLRTLAPFPGRAFAPPDPPDTPEIIAVLEPDGRWRALCDERHFPLFRVDEAAVREAKALAKAGAEARQVSDWESDARRWADAYAERNATLQRMAQILFDRQPAFLDSGGDPATLRPLRQSDIAEALGYDESTVSRALRGKSVRVPTSRKILPIKSFFSHALPVTTDAGPLSDQQAKQALQALVSAEDPHKPLSDQALTDALTQQEIGRAHV